MNSTTFGLPARRLAAATTAALLVGAPVLLATAGTAHATEGHGGKSGAVVLRTGLDVSLLRKTVDLPLHVSLNEVSAPGDADETALTATLDGVDKGRPFRVLDARVARAKATADGHSAEGSTELVGARVHVPGLPLLSLVEVEKVTSRAVCEVGHRPVAEANVLGHVKVLGKTVRLSAGGTTRVEVPGVGEVTLDLSKRTTTATTAAAAALELKVSVDPLKLGVAQVEGTVTLAGATCETPKTDGAAPGTPASEPPASAPADDPADDADGSGDAASPSPAAHGDGKDDEGTRSNGAKGTEVTTAAGKSDDGANLAETGGSSTTPYLAGGAAVLLVGGAGAVWFARNRRAARGN
ncbi:SCO1860 family LAETG-anchored protein [Streptomyces sp. SID11385]|uniref:SCO1860 family LAETG-anchored protein n=1 Tax=Streptomyces sp. SID11385 TaxID=2706031 RepID=UPI0013CCD372|nr:SCO1860 family LAETG-anchored protein [Streptomyces sp. SID11385]NEA42523.1 LPXTG cell wall anchor domain-containing protein [Streptomyces sp. SID11385]